MTHEVFRVRHAKGTAKEKCEPCGGWIAHWKKHSSYYRETGLAMCAVASCFNISDLDGAHVDYLDHEGFKGRTWILPFCDVHHGMNDDVHEVRRSVDPATSFPCEPEPKSPFEKLAELNRAVLDDKG